MTGTNPVGSWLLTNFTTQDPTLYKSAIDANMAVAQRVADNFAPKPSSPAAMTVTLDAGHLFDGAALTEVAAQTTGTITAPSANPRIDRVVIDNFTGSVSVVTGTEAVSPSPPLIPAGKTPIAQARLATTSTTITASMITDERNFSGIGSMFKLGSFTYNLSTASGSLPVTGVGFRPKVVILGGAVSGASPWTLGAADASGGASMGFIGTAMQMQTTLPIVLYANGSDYQTGILSSMDSDGFTLAFTKNNSPTGTATVFYVAIR